MPPFSILGHKLYRGDDFVNPRLDQVREAIKVKITELRYSLNIHANNLEAQKEQG